MFDALSLVSMLYFERINGELAGMNNIILRPHYAFGVRNELTLAAAPKWHNSLDLYALHGNALYDGGKTTRSELLEVRAKLTSLYTFYNDNDVLTFNTGIYSLLAYPIHNYEPYADPSLNKEYSAEESERIRMEDLVGWDFNFKVNYNKSASSFHNIIYFYGERVAPNLLGYRPVLGFDWRCEMFFIGTASHPKLSFFANSQFWFAKKANTKILNTHDGIGATKREISINYGINYFITPHTTLHLESFAYNNLHRGESATDPTGFRDGYKFGVNYEF
jgi:hypothetical protein